MEIIALRHHLCVICFQAVGRSYNADIAQELNVLSFMHRTCKDMKDPRGALIVQ